MDFTIATSDRVPHSPLHSPAVRMGGLVFTSGQVGRNQKGEIVGKGDARVQAEQAFENLRAVLEDAGSGMDLVGKITVFTTNLGHKQAIADVRLQVFGAVGHVPAATFVVVNSLADPNILLEIEAVAAVR